MQRYGLNLRGPPKATSKRPLAPVASAFRDDDDDDDVEKDISRQATRSRALHDAEALRKKALEEDPSAFDYDGVYDEMKDKIAKPKAIDVQERKPRYIQALMKKAEERQRQQEVVYERKLAKERTKEDHLYAEKDKFVTAAYKRKLAEQAKWLEEERLRELKEEKDDVTKKKDLSDFYFNLGKNVAFGAKELDTRKPEKPTETKKPETEKKAKESREPREAESSDKGQSSDKGWFVSETRSATGASSQGGSSESLDPKPVPDKSVSDTSALEKISSDQPPADEPKPDHHKRNQDALAAAKERFLARKRAKEQ
ncbi:hypothetical protein ACFE04_027273 [Oxalis oulophora]